MKMYLILIFGFLISPFLMAESTEKPLLQEIAVPNLKENQTFRLLCALTQGESVDFKWYLNNEKIIESDRKKIRFNEDSSELIIKQLSVDDLGEIKCVASNKYGQDTQKIQLFVNVKPKFTSEPKDVTEILSKDIILECDLKAYPFPTIKWFKLSDDSQKIIKEFESNTVKFKLTKNDAGLYRCVGSNSIGKTEKTIKVKYYGK